MKLTKTCLNINFTLLCLISTASYAEADSLTRAINSAIKTNPTFQAALASEGEAESNLKAAYSGRNPSFRLEAEAGLAQTYQKSSGGVSFGTSGGQSSGTNSTVIMSPSNSITRQKIRPHRGKAVVEQPLYKGGRISAAIDAACHKHQASQFQKQTVKNNLIQKVVNIYLDVVIAETKLALQKKTEQVLNRHLESARLNLKIGSTTRTDVSQAESRLAGAKANSLQAYARLREAQANFEKLVGYAPLNLTFPTLDFTLPTSLDEAFKLAECNNPELHEARAIERASTASLREVKGELLPTLSLRAETGQSDDQFFKNVRTRSSGVYANLSIPLYSGGNTRNRIKAARYQKKQTNFKTQEKLRDIRARVTTAFENVQVQYAKIKARKAETRAANLALQGLTLEAKTGSRTLLDVLDGEKEALNARLNLLTARADYVDAAYELMKLMGKIEL